MSGSYNDHRGIFDPRGMIGRIYVEFHMTFLHIKYTSFVSCGCREDFSMCFHYKSKVDNGMPGVWPVWTPRIYKEEYYTLLHTKYGPCFSVKNIFYVFFFQL